MPTNESLIVGRTVKEYTNFYFNKNNPNADERNQLILAYAPLIKFIASRLASKLPPQVAFDDLVSSGIIGLIDAIDKFNPNKKVLFKTYAEFRVRGAILDELRLLDWVPRSVRKKVTKIEHSFKSLEKKLGRPATDNEMADSLNISLDSYFKLLDETKSVSFMNIEMLRQNSHESFIPESLFTIFKNHTDSFACLNMKQIRNLLFESINSLPKNERETIFMYYFNELTMKQIGIVLECTESRVSQMHSKAMLSLKTKLDKSLP